MVYICISHNIQIFLSVFVFCLIFGLFDFLLKDKRRVYESNLVKVGLELETEDKSVRGPYNITSMFISKNVSSNLASNATCAFCSSPGVWGWKDLLCKDPCSMGCVGHLRKRAEDQGSLQGRRHTRKQQRDPHELAVHAFSSAEGDHASGARLFHGSIQQG